ncbi:hypothetical protein H6G80_34915 [Nostoc sp. FACHB-87]|uniref:hypothetical protein n=1 Tax=Nostocales TaxID=1161 RepID=UPI00168348D4|nr:MULTISPECIES: hypothetical protein [Nostocales]MBD2459216.1 hypothetical protein [Nostoc sp. FACHB-87]MBD2478863.1 hypothetical protein [Anabaena sp. FACHB-83]MBD2491367.1 hypothetical protein [Aulosira sp. FACHB-615]
MSAIAYLILSRTLISHHGRDSMLSKAVGRDFKGKISVLIYGVAIPLTFVKPWFGGALYVLVAIMCLIPDRRIERTLKP